MSDKRISELDLASGLDGTEKFVIDQGGVTVYVEGSVVRDKSDKQDVNARSTLFRTITTLDPALNYTLQSTDKNVHFLWTLAVGRTFAIPGGLPTSGGNDILNVGASFKITNRAASAASITLDVAAVTFEGSTTVAAGATIEITRIATNTYLRS